MDTYMCDICVFVGPHVHICAHEWLPKYMYTCMHV